MTLIALVPVERLGYLLPMRSVKFPDFVCAVTSLAFDFKRTLRTFYVSPTIRQIILPLELEEWRKHNIKPDDNTSLCCSERSKGCTSASAVAIRKLKNLV